MTKCSIYSQRFIYVVVRRIETVSYTKCTKSAVIRHKTLKSQNQRVAKLRVKYYIAIQQIAHRATCKIVKKLTVRTQEDSQSRRFAVKCADKLE